MKKFLSLVLALVMTMSLVTISAGATEFKDLTDVDSIEHKEAVELFNKIGIITGYEDGSFGPEKTITREQAAKIIAIMALGNDAASKLGVEKAPFPDVPATSQFAGYIGYCASTGIINGYNDGTFKPKGTLTGYQFAKMLLGVIGYGVNDEYVGNNWALNVARDGASIGLFKDATVTAGLINRDNATQVAFNALKSSLVTYSDLLGTYVAYNLLDQTLLGSLAQNIFGLTTTSKVDNYGYNVHAWKQDGKIITDYYLTDEIVDTVTDPSVTKGNLYKSYDWEDSVEVWVNGNAQPNVNMDSWKGSTDKYLMNGYTVYLVDEPEKDGTFDGDIDKMIVVKEYLAEVTKVNAATSSTDRSVNLTVYTATGTKTVNKVETESFEKDDYILIVPNDAEGTNNFTYPLEMQAAESVTSAIQAYYKVTGASAAKPVNPNGSVSVEGVKYQYNFIFGTDNGMGQDYADATDEYSLNKGTYQLFLDSNGYVIGVKEVESAISDFAYIIDKGHDAFSQYNIAKVLLSDGTIKTYTISDKSDKYARDNQIAVPTGGDDSDAEEGRIFGYSINESGEIVLDDFTGTKYSQVVATKAAKDLYDDATPSMKTTNIAAGKLIYFTKGYSAIGYDNSGDTTVDAYAYATDETVFAYYNATTGNVSLFTGKSNAPTVKNNPAVSMVVKTIDGKDYAQFVVIADDPAESWGDNYVYVLNGTYFGYGYNNAGDKVYFYDVIKDGVKTAIATKNTSETVGANKYSVKDTFVNNTAYDVENGEYSLGDANNVNSVSQNIVIDVSSNDNVIVDQALASTNENTKQYVIGDEVRVTDISEFATKGTVTEGATWKVGDTVTIVFTKSGDLQIAKDIFITKVAGSSSGSGSSVVYGNDSVTVTPNVSGLGGTIKVNICEDSKNTVNSLVQAKLEELGYKNIQISGNIAYASAANDLAVSFTVSSETLYKVALTIAGDTSKTVSLNGNVLKTGDVIYAGSTGVVLTTTATSVTPSDETNATYTTGTKTLTASGTGAKITLTLA